MRLNKILMKGKPMATNYERIKNMTVEEIAIFLSKSSIGEDIYVNEVIPDRDYWEQWLQSESEE